MDGISFSASGAADQSVLECAFRGPSWVLTLPGPRSTFISSTSSAIFFSVKSYIAVGISESEVVDLVFVTGDLTRISASKDWERVARP